MVAHTANITMNVEIVEKLSENDLIYRLRKRAEIRRQISIRKSVQEGKPDRLADLLDEAADEIEKLLQIHKTENS